MSDATTTFTYCTRCGPLSMGGWANAAIEHGQTCSGMVISGPIRLNAEDCKIGQPADGCKGCPDCMGIVNPGVP